MILKLAGFVVVLGAGYAAYHFLFGHGWLGTSACLLIWFLLASLYKPHSTRPQMWIGGPPDLSDEEKRILFGDPEKRKGPTGQN